MPEQTEAPSSLSWLRSTLDELRKDSVRLGMRVASLEASEKFRKQEAEELRGQIRQLASMVDGSSADMRAAVKGDVAAELLVLARRDSVMANVLTLLAVRAMGPDALERLGAPADQVALVRSMVSAAQPAAPAPRYHDEGNGMRHSLAPSADRELETAPRGVNRMNFTRVSAEEHLLIEQRTELETRERAAHVVPRRVTAESLPSGR